MLLQLVVLVLINGFTGPTIPIHNIMHLVDITINKSGYKKAVVLKLQINLSLMSSIIMLLGYKTFK